MIYNGYHYKVTDAEIIHTGKIELWFAESRQKAIEHALYTHQLHNRNATVSKMGVVTCPSCGQIAIVKGSGLTPRPPESPLAPVNGLDFQSELFPVSSVGSPALR